MGKQISNYLGDEISEKQLAKIADVITTISNEEIDELWHKAGWKEKGCEPNKSLPSWRLQKIRTSKKFAKENLESLFRETPKKEFEEIFRPFLLQKPGKSS